MRINSAIFLMLMIRCSLLIPQDKVISVEIKYLDFTLTTDMKIECSEFEKAGDYKTILITDTTIILTILSMTRNLKIDIVKGYMPDTRAKIILRKEHGDKEIICLSNFSVCYNNTPMVFDYCYANYFKYLIKQNDKYFDF